MPTYQEEEEKLSDLNDAAKALILMDVDQTPPEDLPIEKPQRLDSILKLCFEQSQNMFMVEISKYQAVIQKKKFFKEQELQNNVMVGGRGLLKR